MASTSEPRVVPELASRYDDLLGKQLSNYQNVLGAYGAGQQNLQNQLPGIYGDYGKVTADVDSSYDRAYEVAARDIQAANNRNFGRAQQSLISSGLGGSTMLANLGRRVAEDASRSYERLGADMGMRRSQDRQRVGLAGLAARMQGLGMQTGLQQSMGGTLAGFDFRNNFGNILGQYSRSDSGGAGGVGGGGGNYPSMMGGGGGMGGGLGGGGGGLLGGLEGMLGGLGGSRGGSSTYLGLGGPQAALAGNYWSNMGVNNPFGGTGGFTGSPVSGGYYGNEIPYDASFDAWSPGFEDFGGGGEF